MYAVRLATSSFKMTLVFHDARLEKLSDEAPIISRTIVPIG